MVIILVSTVVIFAVVRRRDPIANQPPSPQIHLPSSNFSHPQPENPIPAITTTPTQFVQPPSQMPDENLTGQIDNGYEWLEFPAQSGIWYYRDWYSRKWIKR